MMLFLKQSTARCLINSCTASTEVAGEPCTGTLCLLINSLNWTSLGSKKHGRAGQNDRRPREFHYCQASEFWLATLGGTNIRAEKSLPVFNPRLASGGNQL